MSILHRFSVIVLAVWAIGGVARPCSAGSFSSRTQYAYDRFGNLTGARVTVNLPEVKHVWVFNLGRSFLNLPVAAQLDLLDRQFNLGDDRKAVGQVLRDLNDSRRRWEQQAQLDRLNRQLAQQRQMQEQLDRLNQQQRLMQPPPIPRPR